MAEVVRVKVEHTVQEAAWHLRTVVGILTRNISANRSQLVAAKQTC
jgi:hypothetical protein